MKYRALWGIERNSTTPPRLVCADPQGGKQENANPQRRNTCKNRAAMPTHCVRASPHDGADQGTVKRYCQQDDPCWPHDGLEGRSHGTYRHTEHRGEYRCELPRFATAQRDDSQPSGQNQSEDCTGKGSTGCVGYHALVRPKIIRACATGTTRARGTPSHPGYW